MELTKVTTTSGILEPGLWQLDPSRERYRVPACGVIVVELYPDDVLVVQDPEGGQHFIRSLPAKEITLRNE